MKLTSKLKHSNLPNLWQRNGSPNCKSEKERKLKSLNIEKEQNSK
jgi:hypothetical protein